MGENPIKNPLTISLLFSVNGMDQWGYINYLKTFFWMPH